MLLINFIRAVLFTAIFVLFVWTSARVDSLLLFYGLMVVVGAVSLTVADLIEQHIVDWFERKSKSG